MAPLLSRSGDVWVPLDLHPVTAVVVQAHSEDFVGGCGGFVRHLADHGAAVTLITLFRSGRDAGERRRREAEIEATGALLKIETAPPLADPWDTEWLTGALVDRFLAANPDLILTPFNRSDVERHSEHVLAGWLVTAAAVTAGMATRRWRYGNVTCDPLTLMTRADRAFVMGSGSLALRDALYRLHASQLGHPPNPRWRALPTEEEASDYVTLTDQRSRYQLRALVGTPNLEQAGGVELFQSRGPISPRRSVPIRSASPSLVPLAPPYPTS